jgi:tRNA pseudouridine13 synthase
MSDEPFLTADLPGTGGVMRERIEDFVVEEIPLYEPSGTGEHLYLLIQKVGISTHEAVRRISHELGVPSKRIGYAGLKDAKAVTRQTISMQGVSEAAALGLEVNGVTAIEARRHNNKLRLGHLAGNRFLIRLRGVEEGAAAKAKAILTRMTEVGVPNIFGPQRFGSKGDAHEVGRAILHQDAELAVNTLLSGSDKGERDPRLTEARERFERGDLEGARAAFPHAYQAERRALEVLIKGRPAEHALRRIPNPVMKIILSSYQSHLFNRLLYDRMPDLGALEVGDLAYLHGRGAVFAVDDPAREQPRADAFEISPSAPLFGKKVLLAEGLPGERERELLAEERLELADFGSLGVKLTGERRALRVPLTEATVREDGEGAILLCFALPKGSYATAVMREVMKEGAA